MIFVIIVTYNGEKWIENCLASLRLSTHPVRIIVVDNASSDNTLRIVQNEFPEVDLINLNQNIGFGKANNVGIIKALHNHAEFLLLLNQDTTVAPDTINQLIKSFADKDNVGLISPVHQDGSGKNLDFAFEEYLLKYSEAGAVEKCISGKSELIEVAFVNAACWLISSEALKKTGGFNPSFPHYGEDNDYINRMKYHGFKIFVLCSATIKHFRKQGKNEFNLIKTTNREFVSFLKIFSNINISIPASVFKVLWKLNRETLFYLLHFKLLNVLSLWKGFFLVCAEFPKIKENRSLAKGEGAFLDFS